MRTFSRRTLLGSVPPALLAASCRTARPPVLTQSSELITRMSLAEKIGQMTQADHKALLKNPAHVEELALGSVLAGGDSLPSPNTLQSWADMVDEYQRRSRKSRLGIPVLFGIDAVHGHNGLHGATIFPHNVGLGCTRNAALVEKIARATAIEMLATGIPWNFAPCIAVPRDERWGRTYEGFGESPELAAELGVAAIRGMQGSDLGARTSVLACAKHFVGDGGTTNGVDQGDTIADDDLIRKLHLPGYRAAVDAGVGTVMASYNSVNGERMHAHARLINGVLKGELGFRGFVVSDWDGIDKIPGDYPAKVRAAVNAGVDLFMIPNRYPEFIRVLRAEVEAGRVPMSRIDDAVARILKQKAALRLTERGFAERNSWRQVGSREHRAIARQAVRESLVLLKHERRLLPLAKDARHIHVVGRRADDVGAQCGGWTVSWQGKLGAVTKGTTILQAIRAATSGTQVTFAADGSGGDGADAIIAVLGEDPYAEMKGDRSDLALSVEDQAVLARAKDSGRPVVLVLLSGRPLVLGAAWERADAIVAAWLPGSEGQGVADMLFGTAPWKGKLSHSWPRSMAQIPINVGDAPYDPLLPYGFGLTI